MNDSTVVVLLIVAVIVVVCCSYCCGCCCTVLVAAAEVVVVVVVVAVVVAVACSRLEQFARSVSVQKWLVFANVNSRSLSHVRLSVVFNVRAP